jgi:lipoprotein signal peptidase
MMELIRHRYLQIGTFFVLIGVDQLSKQIADNNSLTVMNYGGIFGILPGREWILALCTILVFIAYQWVKSNQLIVQWCLVFLMAGGLANIMDRVLLGGVRDFIYYPWFSVYGNIADIYLLMGAVGMMFVEKNANQKINDKDLES